jgi:NAD(P)-dependent dehydrogenase (short-subunit alcohol dehydrogenase family)
MSDINPASLPDLSGKVYLVTGVYTGIGLETVRFLAAITQLYTWLAVTSAIGNAAIASVKAQSPTANIHLLIIDHMTFTTAVLAAKELIAKEKKLNGLIENALIKYIPVGKGHTPAFIVWRVVE